jgi:hypothetical protein
MGRKLTAVCALGRDLCGLTPKEVGHRFFGGITKSAQLGEDHVAALDALPFIGKPSARFIIRNMGGDLIKDDRYLVAIMRYFGCSLPGELDVWISCCGATANRRSRQRSDWRNTFVTLGSDARLTSQCTGPGLALLAPAGDRERLGA